MDSSNGGDYTPGEGRAERETPRRLNLSTPAEQPEGPVREPNGQPLRVPEPDPRDLQPPEGVLDSLPSIPVTDGSDCTVCMDEFEVGEDARQLPCRHLFHEICIKPWFARHATCPTCRYEVPAVARALREQGIEVAPVTREGFVFVLLRGDREPFPRREGRESRPRRDRPQARYVVTGPNSFRRRSPSPRGIPPTPQNSPHPQTSAASASDDVDDNDNNNNNCA